MVQPRIGDGETVGMMVRMSAALRDRIKRAADFNGRSQNSEIVTTLEKAYPPYVPNAADILVGIESVLRQQGEKSRPEQVELVNRMLRAADYPLQVVDDEDGMRLSIAPAKDFQFSTMVELDRDS